jgi:hypothetical protein
MRRIFLSALAGALALALASGWAGSAAAANRVVEVINATAFTMVAFYASVSSTNSWEEDILGDEELEAGDSVDINIDDGSGKCIYDFKGVFDNGVEVVKQGVNVCRIATFTFER